MPAQPAKATKATLSSETISKATCKCGATNTDQDQDRAITFIVHKNGCDNDLTHWQDWITVTKVK